MGILCWVYKIVVFVFMVLMIVFFGVLYVVVLVRCVYMGLVDWFCCKELKVVLIIFWGNCFWVMVLGEYLFFELFGKNVFDMDIVIVWVVVWFVVGFVFFLLGCKCCYGCFFV